MAKDSQLDPKSIRKKKSNGGPTLAESALTEKAEMPRSNPAAEKIPAMTKNNLFI